MERADRVLVPSKSFIKIALAIIGTSTSYIDPIELEKRSGLSRATVYRQLKIMTGRPFEWFVKVDERRYIWREPRLKRELTEALENLTDALTAIQETRKRLRA